MSDELKAKVQQLRDAELKLEDDLVAAKADLAAAREREAAAVLNAALDGDGGKGKGGEGAAVIAERATALMAAIRQARERRVEAIRAAWTAEAEAMRATTEEQRTAADAHTDRVADLLRQLEEIEGCPYMPDGRVYQDGDWGGKRVVDRSRFRTPLSHRLRVQIEAQDRQAAEREVRQVRTSGDVSATSRDELVAVVRAWDCWALAPTLHDLHAWCEAAEAASAARLDRRGIAIEGPRPEDPKDLEFSYTVSWRDGTIVTSSSTIQAFRHQSDYLAGSGRTVDRLVNVA